MATSKGKILKEQITFDFFETMEIVKPVKQKKEKVVINKENKQEKPTVKKQAKFRRNRNNIKPNHRKQNRKVIRVF